MKCPECGEIATFDEDNSTDGIDAYECLECGEQFDETDERLA